MASYNTLSSADISLINQVMLPRIKGDSPAFKWFPEKSVDNDLIIWDQKDDYKGLMSVRGINGNPGVVTAVGDKRYVYQPGYYGDVRIIDESQLTKAGKLGTFGQSESVDAMVAEAEIQLLHLQYAMVEYMIWTLLHSGTFTNTNSRGAVHTDSYPVQTYSPSTVWSNKSASTPLADLRHAATLGAGYGTDFGRGAELWCNRTVANNLLGNTNAADLGGVRKEFGSTVFSEKMFNEVAVAADVAQLKIYDGHYKNSSGTVTRFIPNTKAILIGPRDDGAPLGQFQYTRNANNPNSAPGPYSAIVPSDKPPMKIEVHRGFNGGPLLWYPKSILVLTVAS